MAGLYLHIPFCRRKCPYCDFFSFATSSGKVDDYGDLLVRHLAMAAARGWSGPFDTVYFGGGTPSLLEASAVNDILQCVRQEFGLTAEAEISLEANPGTVSPASLAGYRLAGVNRLSLGLQSSDDHQLTTLGRLHDKSDGTAAFRWAREAGYDNISLDLMFALPGQIRSGLEADLDHYLDLDPEHLSCYGLTAEPHTPFQEAVAAGRLDLPDEEFYAQAFLLIHERLTAAGYEHYEIANYAKSGQACRHNLGYWRRRPCLGVGAGAHSFRAEQWGSRWQVPADLEAYRVALLAGRDPIQCLETFDRRQALSETVYLALRTSRGISDSELRQRFGVTLAEAFPEATAASRPWLSLDQGHWYLSVDGWLLFDRLIVPFL